MKRSFFLIIFGLLMLAVPRATFAADQTHSAASQSAEQKKRYETNMQERLAALGKQLDELKVKGEKSAAEAKTELHRYVLEAEKKKEEAFRKLDALRKTSVKKWKKFSSETDAAADEFEKAYQRAKAHFKE